ncbi:hypothetical protein A7Q09_04970 [Methylacidiphilum sp. Yel]|nr:hypothetical protein A7Q09_04970 [Methylacidiphilum sp. Yel]
MPCLKKNLFFFYLILCHYSFIVAQLFSRKYNSFGTQGYLPTKAKAASTHLLGERKYTLKGSILYLRRESNAPRI